MSINSRIIRSLTEDIKLIFYLKDIDYIFYVLGTSELIYKVVLSKNYQTCNCADYKDSKFCKHICFILFKVLKVFRFDKKKVIVELVKESSLIKSNFLNNFKFEDNEMIELNNRFYKINKMLKKIFFNEKNYLKFKGIYNNFVIFKNTLYCNKESKCVICLEKGDRFVKCPNCNNEYHIDCILKWLNIIDQKKCPLCSNDIWKYIYTYLLMYFNEKLEKNVII